MTGQLALGLVKTLERASMKKDLNTLRSVAKDLRNDFNSDGSSMDELDEVEGMIVDLEERLYYLGV